MHSAKAFSDYKNELIQFNIYHQRDKNPFANPDNNYRIISQLINEPKSIHIPVKSVKFRKHKHTKSSWITPAIQFRDKLYQSYKCAEPNTTNYIALHTNLKTYNRILKRTIRKAKLIYFTGQFDRCQNDIQQTWKAINSIPNKSPTNKTNLISLKQDEHLITDKAEIANKFNSFFTNVGPQLANNIYNNSQ